MEVSLDLLNTFGPFGRVVVYERVLLESFTLTTLARVEMTGLLLTNMMPYFFEFHPMAAAAVMPEGVFVFLILKS